MPIVMITMLLTAEIKIPDTRVLIHSHVY